MKALVLLDATVVVSQRSLVISQGLAHASELIVSSTNSRQRNSLHFQAQPQLQHAPDTGDRIHMQA
ncbi:hypothetical protein D9M71_793720 [compost metagenome]